MKEIRHQREPKENRRKKVTLKRKYRRESKLLGRERKIKDAKQTSKRRESRNEEDNERE